MTSANTVDLYIAPIATIDISECSLSAEERERAEGYRVDAARRAFVAGRTLMRCVLGRAIGCAAADVALTISATGRPELDPDRHPRGPSFSLSHSERTLALGISANCVGVDIEAGERRANFARLAHRILGPEESRFVAPMASDIMAFLAGWTAKEAAAKADGAGLQLEPRNFQLTDLPTPDGPSVTIRHHGAPRFWVRSITLDGEICAVACREPDFELNLSTFNGGRLLPHHRKL